MIVIGEALHNFFFSKTSFHNQHIQISSQLMQLGETFKESRRGEVPTLALLIHKKPNKVHLLAYARKQSYE